MQHVPQVSTTDPQCQQSTLKLVPSLASDTSSVTLKSTDLPPFEHNVSAVTSPVEETVPARVPSNPWLATNDDTTPVQKKHEVAISKDSATVEKSKNKVRKRTKKREEEKQKAKEDAAVDISLSNVMTLGSTAGPSKTAKSKQPSRKRGAQATNNDDDDDESDANSEVDAQENVLQSKGKGRAKGVKAFEQRDLVARAFAGDNVVQVSLPYTFSQNYVLNEHRRTSRMPNSAKYKKTPRRRSTPHFQAGFVSIWLRFESY